MTESQTLTSELTAAPTPAVDTLAAQLEQLQAQRAEVATEIERLRLTAEVATRKASAAAAERDDMQARCVTMSAHSSGPPAPLERLGRAVLDAGAAQAAAIAASEAHEAESQTALAKLREIDGEIRKVDNAMKRRDFHNLVGEFEQRARAAELGKLSDQIRAAALAAGISLEERSPLFDDEHRSVANYPLDLWR
ncbi:MAG: hypothetical protein NVS9B10_15040 [Nevskia sp.]